MTRSDPHLLLQAAPFLRRGLTTPRLMVEVLLGLMPVVFAAIYFFGLAGAYRTGEMSVAYPLARSLPVLLVPAASLALGRGGQIGAAALVATAVGLAAAIPAVIAFNYSNARLSRLVERLDAFRAELEQLLRRRSVEAA